MQVCTSLQTDNHARTPPLSFLQARCPSCRPTNSVKALKAHAIEKKYKNQRGMNLTHPPQNSHAVLLWLMLWMNIILVPWSQKKLQEHLTVVLPAVAADAGWRWSVNGCWMMYTVRRCEVSVVRRSTLWLQTTTTVHCGVTATWMGQWVSTVNRWVDSASVEPMSLAARAHTAVPGTSASLTADVSIALADWFITSLTLFVLVLHVLRTAFGFIKIFLN